MAAGAVTCFIGWGFIVGLWQPDRTSRPILIMAKIVMVRPTPIELSSVRLDYRPRYLPVNPPPIVQPPLPEFSVAAPNAKFSQLSPPRHEHVQPDRGMADLSPAPPPADYLSSLLAHLTAYRRYPYAARLHREQGTVRLEFTMDRAGKVLSYRIVGSSGFADLDDEARQMIQDAQPLPPVPASYPGTTLDLVLPLVFSLS